MFTYLPFHAAEAHAQDRLRAAITPGGDGARPNRDRAATRTAHPRTASRTGRYKARLAALLVLSVVGAVAVALVSPWGDGHTAQATQGVSSVAAHSRTVGPAGRWLPASYRGFPESKLVALGIVPNPKTGQWMCVLVRPRRAAPSSHYSRVAFRP
jgi:hypothetical protein